MASTKEPSLHWDWRRVPATVDLLLGHVRWAQGCRLERTACSGEVALSCQDSRAPMGRSHESHLPGQCHSTSGQKTAAKEATRSWCLRMERLSWSLLGVCLFVIQTPYSVYSIGGFVNRFQSGGTVPSGRPISSMRSVSIPDSASALPTAMRSIETHRPAKVRDKS